MKKLILIFGFFVILFLGAFYGQRPVTKEDGGINPTIKDSLTYFYEKMSSYASIPYKDAQAMFQWGYKKLTRQPTSQSELIQARKAFFRTGVPAVLVLSILARFLYKKIKIPTLLLEADVLEEDEVEAPISPGKLGEDPLDEPPLADLPVPDEC